MTTDYSPIYGKIYKEEISHVRSRSTSRPARPPRLQPQSAARAGRAIHRRAVDRYRRPDLDGAPQRKIVRDTSGQEAWNFYYNMYRPDGSLAEQVVFNRDRSRIISEFNEPGADDWDERHTVITPDGNKVTFEDRGDGQLAYNGGDGQLSETASPSTARKSGRSYRRRSSPRSLLLPSLASAKASASPRPGWRCSPGSRAGTAGRAPMPYRLRRMCLSVTYRPSSGACSWPR